MGATAAAIGPQEPSAAVRRANELRMASALMPGYRRWLKEREGREARRLPDQSKPSAPKEPSRVEPTLKGA